MESKESESLVKLNMDYIDLFYSPQYQRILKKEKFLKLLKQLEIRQLFHILYGRLIYNKLVSKKNNVGSQECTIPSTEYKEGIKVAVYTCIVGGYDTIKEPLYVNSQIDYYIFTDTDVPDNSIWKKIDINLMAELKDLNNVEKNRYIKMQPHKYLSNYDYSIYVDGSIQIIADVLPLINEMGDRVIGVHRHNLRNCIYLEANGIIYSKRASKENVMSQVNQYIKEQYPKDNGLYENTILIRQHNRKECIELMETWWDEYMNTNSKRDQLSFPYVIWKTGFPKTMIYILGNDLDKNPRFRRMKRHLVKSV